jgi:dienelactone hydrolase
MLCKAKGFLFASAYRAGNDVPKQQRIRIILDVLDDLRRNYNIDPDRTYIGGFSGGGRVACGIAFALPEYFGGVMPACASGDVREESWLRQRVADRLSVALLTGDKDFNHGEVSRLRNPYLEAIGVRSKVWVQPGLGHAVPGDKVLGEAVAWLEAGLPKRQEQAKRFGAMRRAAADNPSRADQAKTLLGEGKARLDKPETVYSGLMLLKGVLERWNDTPSAAEARKILLEYQDKPERPWEADDIAEQRKFLIARARVLDAYVSGPLDPVYAKQKGAMAKQALEMWQQVADDSPDSPAGMEAKKRIPELRKLAEE